MLRIRLRWSATPFLWLSAACSDGSGPSQTACTAANAATLSLAVAEYAAVNPAASSGCVLLPRNTGGVDAEFLVVPQSATGAPGITQSFSLRGAGAPTATAPAAALVGAEAAISSAEQFHLFLRRGEEARVWGTLVAPVGGPAAPAAAPPALGPKPTVGELRKFSVCAKLDCSRFDSVWARARAVGKHLAIFVDTLAPAGGLDSLDLDTLKTVFDTRLYPIDTAAFGNESDINQDSVVIVLMTNVVNKLVTEQECRDKGFVVGFFLGADIDPLFQNDPRVNRAEIFYSVVADPTGALSCAHSRAQVKRVVPITFIHEFQHMISYNQHVLVGRGDGERLWLNEALSHYAEELGGRSYLADTPPDNQRFTDFVIGNLFNAYKFLEDPGAHFVLPTEGIGSLAERGAGWLFLRFVVDQYAGGTTRAEWDAFTRRLVQTTRTGASNVEFVTGAPFAQSATRWALANWVDDLPGFATPDALKYLSWNLRDVFQQLNSQNPSQFPRPFPLVPTTGAGSLVNLSGTLRAGSGVYHRATQATGADAFTLRFAAANGGTLPTTAVPRLNVIRIR